jgi:nitrate/nitrite transporter NarK
MGIWATWVPVGSLVMYLLAPTLAASFGWQSIWWFSAALPCWRSFCLDLMRTPRIPAPHMNEPEAQAGPMTGEPPAEQAPGMRKALANRSIWLLGLEFACFNLGLGAISTFYPTFLSTERGFTLAGAALISSLMLIVVTFFAPLSGVMSDKIGSRKLVFTIPFLILAFMMLFPFKITGWLIPAWMVLLVPLSERSPR